MERRCLFIALVGHPSSDGVTIKIPMGYMFDYINQSRTPSFPIELFKIESDLIVRSVETDLGKRKLVVAVISVDAYPFFFFFGFLGPDLSP